MDKSDSTSGDRMTQDKDGQKSTQTQQRMDEQKSTTGQSQMGKDAQKDQAQTPGATQQKEHMTREGQKGTEGTVGAAGSGAVNLTTEQRTTIRSEVLTERAPRVDNVNFSINVGTVVPSHVRVVEVPPAIIKIRPEWRGYRYFVYQDEIIIVEPSTLKIIAVLEV